MPDEEPIKHGDIYEALHAFQSEAGGLKLAKDSTNPHFKSKFLSLDKLSDEVRPLLAKHGLIWTTMPGHTEAGAPTLRYRLAHRTGANHIEGVMLLLPGKADPQGQGAAITYARRYVMCAVLGLVADEDDDGERAMQRASQPAARQATGSRKLTDDELQNVATAVATSGKDEALLLGAVGAASLGELTLAQWNQMRPMLVAEGGAE